MTNGEKIQHDFECEVCDPIIEDNIIHVIFADKSDSAIGFDWDWWNAEYKEPNSDIRLNRVENELNQDKNELEPTTKNDLGVDWDELKRRIFMEVNGGTDDKWLRYADVCDRISDSIDKFVADMRGEE